MTKLLFFIAVFVSIIGLSQTSEDPCEKLESSLNEAKSYKRIYSLLDSIGNHTIFYSDLFLKIPCINPLNPKNIKRISSSYGKRYHPIDKKYKKHNGIDISSNIGTTVHAAADGVVTNIEYAKTGYGKNVTIKHAYGYTTKYAHMALILVLKQGQKVKLGEIIGMVGSTGKSTGNHLHYEIKKDNFFVNPSEYMILRKTTLDKTSL